jgi:hypothetical protein
MLVVIITLKIDVIVCSLERLFDIVRFLLMMHDVVEQRSL